MNTNDFKDKMAELQKQLEGSSNPTEASMVLLLAHMLIMLGRIADSLEKMEPR
jgi:hypothetical protein